MTTTDTTPDMNLLTLRGRLACQPARNEDENGRTMRLLVSVRSGNPRRVDVLPIIIPDPPDELWDSNMNTHTQVWVSASVRRRFTIGEDGRRSALELVAKQVQLA